VEGGWGGPVCKSEASIVSAPLLLEKCGKVFSRAAKDRTFRKAKGERGTGLGGGNTGGSSKALKVNDGRKSTRSMPKRGGGKSRDRLGSSASFLRKKQLRLGKDIFQRRVTISVKNYPTVPGLYRFSKGKASPSTPPSKLKPSTA